MALGRAPPWPPSALSAVGRPLGLLRHRPYSSHGHRLPDNATSLGSTNDWLAVGLSQKHTTDDDDDDELYYVVHNYVLHNPFSNRSLPLPELDAIIDDGGSIIFKFLMRSTVDDVIVVITSNRKHPFIVFQRGKGAWSPEPEPAATSFIYMYIIDIAFLGDKLYAITTAEDLIPLDLTWDGDGRPMVTMGTWVIEESFHYDDYYDSSTTFDEEDDDDQNEEEEDEQEEEEDEQDNDEEEEDDNAFIYTNFSAEYDQDVGPDVDIRTSRHLVESHGKLLMVRHRHQHHEHYRYPGTLWDTLQVDVFEADFSTHAWVPLTGGLGGGRALFVSMNFSKSVPAPCGEVEEDAIYLMETESVYNMKSGTCSPSKFAMYSMGVTWLFPPE
ncbi:hypothetical protein ZWY2020_017099 [Hordeum vulgare]|nr:hypothetical protein ZWY2020_017099 [Hordeum vulgare]